MARYFSAKGERQAQGGPATGKAVRPVSVSGFQRTVVADVG